MSPRTGLNLNTILKEAAQIANEDGIEALSITTLATKLKIKPPSLYNHVDSLHDLKKKLSTFGLQRLLEYLTRSVEGLHGDEAVVALSKAYITFARTEPGLYEMSLNAPDAKDVVMHQTGEKIIELVLKVLDSYQLSYEESIHVVRGLRSILHGFASLEQRGGFGLSLDVDVSINLLIETFLLGIHSKIRGK
ncbi:TetR/AcrR family transcriptional regulator [Halalkalibacter akibai]|uniref:Transcriptional regulator n=1 Tax=Halalkalibacter akibai (strain ATCC 43226 / DSM 21942 / CIP 109018 / JCM 9157 / 1139) TaxID=1236973 RepID=W4QY20_HALA3|nr:TetR/AcrR family transcriptional regulator [Halalkalibacter akibai]GAE36976.1 transcriptional regulator [Halalkalibacter akibai JCM 9157]